MIDVAYMSNKKKQVKLPAPWNKTNTKEVIKKFFKVWQNKVYR